MAFTEKFKYIVHHFILLELNSFDIMLTGKRGDLNTLCHSCRFDYQHRVLKTFPGPSYLCSEDKVV